ncbi:MAG: sulfotransferase [Bacteroidota bacterium]|nr:sulfotransferase [Bacteroidota bacterium]
MKKINQKNQVCLIGCCPSSGSTLLADILDAQNISMCGPELCLFANPTIYGKSPENCLHKFALCPTPYKIRNRPYFHNLKHYSLNKSYLKERLANDDLNSFVQKLANDYFSKESKQGGIFFEKTPENNHYARNYLQHFKNGWYLFVIRNPIYVFNSMLNRGFSKKASLINWFVEAYLFIAMSQNQNVMSIRYEDLIKNPWRTVKNILVTINPKLSLEEDEIEKNYRNNNHRKKTIKRPKSWSISSNDGIVDANNKELNDNIKQLFSAAKGLKIHDRYADKFNYPSMTFMEIIEHFGYQDSLKPIFKNYHSKGGRYTSRDWRKVLKGAPYSSFNLQQLISITQPVQSI